MYSALLKRFVDFGAAFVLLVGLCPVIFFVALFLIFANKGTNIFFFQKRPGYKGKIFKVIKFKTMTDERDAEGNLLPDEQRMTKIGRFVRSTSLDELPQLFNVLKGEMSLVGPRPERPQFVQKFRDEIPRYMVKHQVRPGMTGWAQINGYRGDTSIEKRIEYDLYYIENWTMVFDMKILILTIFKGFFDGR